MNNLFFTGEGMIASDVELRKLYEQDQKSCAEIASICYCSETTIYNRLKSIGVIIRSRSEAHQIFSDTIFVSLYNIGLSVSQIGRLLGVDSSTVTKRLHTLHFPLRSRCVASRIRYTEDEFQRYFMVPEIVDQLVNGVNK